MHKVVTSKGWEFNAESFVKIDEKYYDMDEMNEEQRYYIAAKLNVQGLNAAYAGERVYHAEGLRPFREVFPDIVRGEEVQRKPV